MFTAGRGRADQLPTLVSALALLNGNPMLGSNLLNLLRDWRKPTINLLRGWPCSPSIFPLPERQTYFEAAND
jgi:hypothetical protein